MNLSFLFLFFRVTPQSPRWLKVRGKEKQLIKELMIIVRRKGGDITEEYLNKFRTSSKSNDVSFTCKRISE